MRGFTVRKLNKIGVLSVSSFQKFWKWFSDWHMESCPSGRRCSTRNAVDREVSRVRIPNSPPSSSQAMYRLWRFFYKKSSRTHAAVPPLPKKFHNFSGTPLHSKQAGLLDFSFLHKRAERAFFQSRTEENRDRTASFQPDALIFQGSKRRNFLFPFLSRSICSESLGHPAKTSHPPSPVQKTVLTNNPNGRIYLPSYWNPNVPASLESVLTEHRLQAVGLRKNAVTV